MLKFSKNPKNILGLIFLLVGIFVVLISIKDYIAFSEFKETAVITEGTITDIETKVKLKDGKRKESHTVYYEYIVDGVTYEKKTGNYDNSMSIGSSILLYYDPLNPDNIQLERGNDNFFGIGFGSIFSLIGFVIILSYFKKLFKFKRLKKTGYLVYAEVESVSVDNSVSIGGVHPSYLNCIYVDSQGKTYKFKSNAITEKVGDDIIGKTFPVYMSTTNSDDYFVDSSYFN